VARTEHLHPNWQERCYHLLYAADDLILDMGRAVWPHQGVRRAFLGVSTGTEQHCVRTEEPLLAGDDPDAPRVGDLRVEPLIPLREVALSYRGPDGGLAVELTYRARLEPLPTTPLLVEQDGAVATHYMNFFQSGVYDGWVEVAGRRHEVVKRRGFRDRGWGVRKHEGAPRRGLVLAAFCELGDRAVYLLLFETASGRRVLQDGWIAHVGGGVEQITDIAHDLAFDDDGLLAGGELTLTVDGGQRVMLTLDPRVRLFLAGVGYSADPQRQAPGRERFDLTDAAVVETLRGQTDHGTVFTFDGQSGHGYVETGLGVHHRYRPEPKEADRART
jgi:hypothetical protein